MSLPASAVLLTSCMPLLHCTQEAVLIKCWDSRGRDFAAQHTLDAGAPTVPATFSLHSGFDDPATREDAPDRESIEVRTVAFFDA